MSVLSSSALWWQWFSFCSLPGSSQEDALYSFHLSIFYCQTKGKGRKAKKPQTVKVFDGKGIVNIKKFRREYFFQLQFCHRVCLCAWQWPSCQWAHMLFSHPCLTGISHPWAHCPACTGAHQPTLPLCCQCAASQGVYGWEQAVTDCTQEALKVKTAGRSRVLSYFIFVCLIFFVLTLIKKTGMIVIWGRIQSLYFIPVLLIDAENDACFWRGNV